MKKILISSVIAISLATVSQADFLGAEVGYSTWMPSLSGSIKGSDANDVDINLEDTLGFGSTQTTNQFWASFDHPVPFVPNIKLFHTSYSDSASKTTTATFDGKNYSGTVNTELTLDQTDVIAYYRLLDNWVNFDLGINFKILDGNVKMSATVGVTDTNKDFEAVIPMLYAKARFDMPFTGLSVEADANYIGYNGSKFTDMKAGVVYETSYGLGATLGYRAENITIDDIGDTNTDIDIKGIYAGVFYHF
jgi:outer membrane protein